MKASSKRMIWHPWTRSSQLMLQTYTRAGCPEQHSTNCFLARNRSAPLQCMLFDASLVLAALLSIKCQSPMLAKKHALTTIGVPSGCHRKHNMIGHVSCCVSFRYLYAGSCGQRAGTFITVSCCQLSASLPGSLFYAPRGGPRVFHMAAHVHLACQLVCIQRGSMRAPQPARSYLKPQLRSLGVGSGRPFASSPSRPLHALMTRSAKEHRAALDKALNE